MNELYPQACMATLKVLENCNLDVEYPLEQTCCGQPMANSGCAKDAEQLAYHFVETFKQYDYIVAPSGSCVTMVKEHYKEFFFKIIAIMKKYKLPFMRFVNSYTIL